MVRPDFTRSRASAERQRRAGANSHFGDGAIRIPAAVESAAAPSSHFPVASRGGAGSAHDCRAGVWPHTVNGRNAPRRRTRGRRAAIHRGGDAARSRAWRAKGRRGHSVDLTPIAGGAPRPAGVCARSRPDRRGAGPKLLLCLSARCRGSHGAAQGLGRSLASIRPGASRRTRPFSSSKACPRRQATGSSMR